MNETTKMDYILRFINTDYESLSYIKNALQSAPRSVRDYYKIPKNYVITYVITESLDLEVIRAVTMNISAEKVDVFIGVRPKCDSDIIDIPDYVTRLLSIAGVKMTLSYTL